MHMVHGAQPPPPPQHKHTHNLQPTPDDRPTHQMSTVNSQHGPNPAPPSSTSAVRLRPPPSRSQSTCQPHRCRHNSLHSRGRPAYRERVAHRGGACGDRRKDVRIMRKTTTLRKTAPQSMMVQPVARFDQCSRSVGDITAEWGLE